MDYKSCCDWMFSRFPTFQKYGKTAFKPGLEKIEFLTQHLKSQLANIKIVHIAGTNGKGSTSVMTASALKHAGYKVGLFTSPHFLSFVERIKIDGNSISEEQVVELINSNKTALESEDASFFEISLWLALEHFVSEQVDCIVLETGLGGRLDATNFIENTLLSIITNIGIDHTNLLGDTLELIAKEKAGIIKPNSICLVGEYQSEIYSIFENICKSQNTDLYISSEFELPVQVNPQLKGTYQLLNAKTAYSACQILKSHLPKLTEESIIDGINLSQETFFLPGRWQKIATNPPSIFDMGHNKSGVQLMLKQLELEKYDNLHIVWSMVSDKDVDEIFALLPKTAQYYFCEMNNPRGLKNEELQELGKKHKLNFQNFENPNLAINTSLSQSKSSDLILCGGSAFLISEIFETFFCKSLAELKKHTIFATVNNKKGN